MTTDSIYVNSMFKSGDHKNYKCSNVITISTYESARKFAYIILSTTLISILKQEAVVLSIRVPCNNFSEKSIMENQGYR